MHERLVAGPAVLLVSTRAGGVGLSLTAASRVYLMDLWWNAAVDHQAMQRVHRIGRVSVAVCLSECEGVWEGVWEAIVLMHSLVGGSMACCHVCRSDAARDCGTLPVRRHHRAAHSPHAGARM